MGNTVRKLFDSLKTSQVDSQYESYEGYQTKLLYNDYRNGNTVLANLEKELSQCEEFIFSVAFITKSGLVVLKETLKELQRRGIRGRILTTDYLAFNEPGALSELLQFTNLEVRVFTQEHFHTKGYIFKQGELYTLVVGSSNMTQQALKANKEWNLRVTSLENGRLLKDTLQEFELMWNHAEALTTEWIQNYEEAYRNRRLIESKIKVTRLTERTLQPNKMQIEATRALAKLRQEQKSKALLISATGTGKTYLSAFDVRNVKPKRLLFLVHREQILKQAMQSFKNVLGEGISMGLLTGSSKEVQADYLFSTVQMMGKVEVHEQFPTDYFDYIIVDETHKAGAEGYRRIMEYFEPVFLLGMTATPERSDGFDIYQLFGHNIAYEIRLQKAMEENLLCPFHYFGVSELCIDGEVIDDTTEFRYLVSDDRVDNIIDKVEFYGHSGDRVKGLIFCSTKKEAQELSGLFNERGYQTVSLSGEDSQEVRETQIRRLEQEEREGGLDYIFTVDIFNEGVDIPGVNQIVMLRPTQSSIVFVQQLGRGLRKAPDKDYVVVIDFIGNYKKNFLIPIALCGDKTYNKDTIRRYIAEGNRVIPGCSTVNFDEISKKRIYESIDAANFNDVKLIKESYQELKAKLGRIPNLMDFEEYGSIDVTRIFENSNLGSYHKFLSKYEKEYSIPFNAVQEKFLEFISKKLANGKRVHELLVLERAIKYRHDLMQLTKKTLEEEYQQSVEEKTIVNVANVLTNEFPTGTGKATYKECVFIEKEKEDYKIAKPFDEVLEDENFYKAVMELLEFGLARNKKYYGERYKETSFQLYQKYTYEDVCRLLEWEKGEVPLNIGGYKYDKKSKTYPVFINYDKAEDIKASIDYKDRFITPSLLIAESKPGRTVESEDIVTVYKAEKLGIEMELFVRKNKDDKISKEFYYLGKIHAIGDPVPLEGKEGKKKVVEIHYELETPVREDIYEYITG